MRVSYFVLIGAIVGYIALPTISNMVAGMTFKNEPAPWESVVGLYFPTGSNGSAIESPHFSKLSQCRNWAKGMRDMHLSSGRGANASAVCGWGILRADDKTGLPAMRDFIEM